MHGKDRKERSEYISRVVSRKANRCTRWVALVHQPKGRVFVRS
jgi:hypothetical protein